MTHPEIDPAWWAPAFVGAGEDGPDLWEPVEVVSRHIGQLAEAAPEGSLHREVLTALAVVTSAMLQPESWDEPFTPFMVMGGRRSTLPEDLSDEQFELLRECLPLIAEPALRARVADAIWFHRDRSDPSLLALAVDAYLEVPLVPDAWVRRGADSWWRAVELVRRRGAAEQERRSEISRQLRERVAAGTPADGFMLVDLADLLRVTGEVDQVDRRAVAAQLVATADGAAQSGNLRLARHLERAACQWFRSSGDSDAADEATERVASLYVREADQREAGTDASALAAGIFIEKAIATLMTLPRKFRIARGLDHRVSELRARLADVREASLEQMHRFTTDPIDLTEAVADTRRRLSGLSRFEALAAYATIWSLSDPERERATAEELAEGSLAHLFGGATYSRDGRKVAITGGGLDDSDARIRADMTRNWSMKLGIVATAFLVPGLEVIAFEHRYDLGYLQRMCADSPWVPAGHEDLWARGLRHGLAGDFPSAVSVLIPQVEQALRRALKSNGVHTLFVDPATGVETEKSLPALLELPEANQLLGPSLHFEMSTLLLQQSGANLRHDVAHGLLDDAQAWSASAVYGWWLCLLLVVVPLVNARAAGQAPEEGAAPSGPGPEPDSDASPEA
jgi:uncharacterized protein DUF4209